MPRLQNIRSKRLLVDELIRAIQQIEYQSSEGIAEMSLSIQQNVDRLKGLIELNKYDDTTVKKNIDSTKNQLDSQIKELKQMILDYNKRADENARSINQMRTAIEGEIHKLKAQPQVVNNRQEIVQTVDTSSIEEELRRQKENQKIIAEYVKAHQEEQKKTNDQYQASLDRLIAQVLNSENQPKPQEIPDYSKQIEDINNRLLTVQQRGVPARMTPTFAHLQQNYYTKDQVDAVIISSAGGGGGTGTVFGEPRGIAYFDTNSALASNVSELKYDFDANTFLIGASSQLKQSKIYAQSNYTGTSPNYGLFLAASWLPGVNTTALVGGLGFTVQTNDNTNFSGQVKGIEGFMFHGGSGYLGQALGASFIVQNNAGGHINAVYGASFAAQNNSVGGQIDVAAALYAGPPSSLGTITLMYGVEVDNQGGPGISNAIGIYLKNQTGAAGLNYALYGEGGTVGWNMNGTNSDFQIKGQADANTFYLDASQNALGIGTNTPQSKLDIAGSVTIGSAVAGNISAPSQGVYSEGTIAQGSTGFSAQPGASATVFGFVSMQNDINNSSRGGMYFRTVQNGENRETFGTYNLISTSGGVITASGTHILGIQNEVYLQNVGTTAAFDNANGTLNFMEANGANAHAVGVNNILYGSGDNTQTIGMTNIMPTSDASGTHAGVYTYMASTNATATGVYGGHEAVLTWSSPSATILANVVSAFGMPAVNNPTQKQIGMFIDWNIPGTDTSFAKWAVYVNSTTVDSARSYFGDSVLFRKKTTIVEGTNGSMGVATLTGGTVDVSANIVTNSTRIFLTSQNAGVNIGDIYVAGRTAGTGFTMSSTNVLDGRIIAYQMFEPTT